MISNDKILDQNLTWSGHIKHPSKTMTSSIWLLSKVKKFISQEQHILYTCSLIFNSILIFVILFWLAPLKQISRKFLSYRKEHFV